MAGYELPAVPSDVSALMPPASQGAEQRPERHAGRTGFRWGLRALVVGGLAGAAWLLSGAAAHAADHASAAAATGGLAVLSPAQHVEPLVQGLGNGVAERTVEPVVIRVTKARSTADSDHAHPGVPGVVRVLTAPLRPTGGPVGATRITGVTRAVTATPLIRTVGRVTGLLHSAVPVAAGSAAGAPARPAGASGRVPATAARPAAHVRPAAAPAGSAPVIAPARETGASSVVPFPAVGPTAGSEDARTTGANALDTMRRFADADRHLAATTARPGSVRPAPGSPDPVPVRVQLGAVSGIPASGAGSPLEGGCAAIVPAAVAASSVACHRLPTATDVEVRRYDAESPTVSPD
jgi:hypothetical protein